jgi:hypothetical protein
MKFFFALAIFFLYGYIFFWFLTFTITSPTVLSKDSFIDALNLNDLERVNSLDQINNFLEPNKITDEFYLEPNYSKKKNGALFLTIILTGVSIFMSTAIFFKKSHILLPMITASVAIGILFSIVWNFSATLPVNLLLDMQSIRTELNPLTSTLFLFPYFGLFIFLIFFGNWYKI